MAVDWRSLAVAHAYRQIALGLIDLEQARGVFDFDHLAADPFDEITHSGDLSVRLDYTITGDCAVAGYYRPDGPDGPEVVVHPSWTATRDNFTVLHEFAHHLQWTHLEWSDVWCTLVPAEARILNERIADHLAGEILVPESSTQPLAMVVTASYLAEVHSVTPAASRSAIASAALRTASPRDDITVAVVDLDGKVLFARSYGQLMAPRAGVVQESFANLVSRALHSGGRASGTLNPGIEAASGRIQDNVGASVAIDESGGYAFVVARPLNRFDGPGWVNPETECPNPACGAVFEPAEAAGRCAHCGALRCPECGSCSCPSDTQICPQCSMALSLAEQANPGLHECW